MNLSDSEFKQFFNKVKPLLHYKQQKTKGGKRKKTTKKGGFMPIRNPYKKPRYSILPIPPNITPFM